MYDTDVGIHPFLGAKIDLVKKFSLFVAVSVAGFLMQTLTFYPWKDYLWIINLFLNYAILKNMDILTDVSKKVVSCINAKLWQNWIYINSHYSFSYYE